MIFIGRDYEEKFTLKKSRRLRKLKRKIFSVLFALVLVVSFSLVTAVPAAAQTTLEVTLVATHAGIAEWSCAQQHSGSSSVKMKAPGKCDWNNWAGTYADALIQIPLAGTTLEGLTLDGIEAMSWWNYLVSGYPPALRIKLDVDGDGSSDYHLVGEFAYQEWDAPGFACTVVTPWVPYTHYKPGLEATNDFYYPTYNTWMQTFHTTDDVSGARPADTVTTTVHGDTIFWTMVVGGVYGTDWCSAPYSTGVGAASYFATLDNYKTAEVSNLGGTNTLPILGDAEVLMLEFAITNEIGLTEAPAGHEVYFDDIVINSTTYDLELPAARPLTVDDDRAQLSTAYFQTIQGAVDCAIAGETVQVYAGTYNENILVNKSLTIQAASSPVIDGVDTLWVPAVEISAADVTLQGFTIQNFKADASHDLAAVFVHGDSAIIEGNTIADITTADPGGNPFGIGIDVTANSVDVTGNTVHDVDSIGIRVRARFGEPGIRMTGVILQDNTVYNTGNSGVLVVGNVTDITINNGNEIYNSLEPTPYSLFIAHGPDDGVAPSYVTVEGNTIYGGYSNVIIAGASYVTISGNTITGAIPLPSNPDVKGKNIYILDDYLFGTNTLSTNIEIINNDIQNGGYGVRIATGTGDASQMAATTTINYNDIYGNTEYGVENTISTAVVDATYNWWGDASGPTHADNPFGIGDAVSANVDFDPWLLAEGSTTYYNKTLALKDGWTLVSTDKEVTTGTAWVTPVLAYKYTPSGSFVEADLADLEPPTALYVKTAGGGGVGINYAEVGPAVYSKELEAGWNLISSSSDTTANALLSQLRYVIFGTQQGAGLATLVSQGDYNQFSNSFYLPTLTDANWDALGDYTLNPFDGYWAYMNAAKTFEVIP